jgi:hypothetical protein
MKRLIIILLICLSSLNTSESGRQQTREQQWFTYLRDIAPLTRENLFYAMDLLQIKSPETVYAQAFLETGGFTSRACLECNNLFGMKKPVLRRSTALSFSDDKYAVFYNWFDCVEDYGYWQRFYEARGHDLSDYNAFLASVGYAEDKNYINKLKKLMR